MNLALFYVQDVRYAAGAWTAYAPATAFPHPWGHAQERRAHDHYTKSRKS